MRKYLLFFKKYENQLLVTLMIISLFFNSISEVKSLDFKLFISWNYMSFIAVLAVFGCGYLLGKEVNREKENVEN